MSCGVCRSQMRLGSRVAVAVAVASSHSSDSTPSLRVSIYFGCGPKKQKKKKKKRGFDKKIIALQHTDTPMSYLALVWGVASSYDKGSKKGSKTGFKGLDSRKMTCMWLLPLPYTGCWGAYQTPPCFSFPTCKMGIIGVPSWLSG